LTLVQFTTADITDIYFPLMKHDPWLSFYFGPAYLIITLLLMNLVTASLVNHAIDQGKEDQDLKMKKLRKKIEQFEPELIGIFQCIDHDTTGDIDMEELIHYDIDGYDGEVSHEIRDLLKPENLADNYECFDADGTGTVSMDEFVQGCLAILTKDVPIEITQLLQLVRNNGLALKKLQRSIERKLGSTDTDSKSVKSARNM